jgi:succinate dehydrogenase/fumarate reductase flavoprotein subunit
MTVTESPLRDAERELQALLDVSAGERPWQIRDGPRRSMLENFGVFRREDQMARQLEIIDELRERYDRGVVIEDKGDVFNTDLTQAIELGYLLPWPPACSRPASRARRAAAPTRGRTTSRAATTRTSSSTRSPAGTRTAMRPCSRTSRCA